MSVAICTGWMNSVTRNRNAVSSPTVRRAVDAEQHADHHHRGQRQPGTELAAEKLVTLVRRARCWARPQARRSRCPGACSVRPATPYARMTVAPDDALGDRAEHDAGPLADRAVDRGQPLLEEPDHRDRRAEGEQHHERQLPRVDDHDQRWRPAADRRRAAAARRRTAGTGRSGRRRWSPGTPSSRAARTAGAASTGRGCAGRSATRSGAERGLADREQPPGHQVAGRRGDHQGHEGQRHDPRRRSRRSGPPGARMPWSMPCCTAIGTATRPAICTRASATVPASPGRSSGESASPRLHGARTCPRPAAGGGRRQWQLIVLRARSCSAFSYAVTRSA